MIDFYKTIIKKEAAIELMIQIKPSQFHSQSPSHLTSQQAHT
jgi:hypothetical protein